MFSKKEGIIMLKRLNIILNYVIGSFIGVFIAHSIYKYFEYTKNPDLYRSQSAPWYRSIQVNGLAVGLIIFIAIIIKLLIRGKYEIFKLKPLDYEALFILNIVLVYK